MGNIAKLKKTAIDRTTAGIQEHMFRQMEALADGEITPQNAAAQAQCAGVVIRTSIAEMQYARFVSAARADDGQPRALPLGNAR